MERRTYASLHLSGSLSRHELDLLRASGDIECTLRSRPDFISATKYQRIVSGFRTTLEQLEQGADFITLLDDYYPPMLSNISSAPPVLFFKGDITLLSELLSVSIVGARKADAYGRTVARSISRELAHAGLVVVSGLAIGVDSEAHRGAIEANGKTVAVMGSGLDKPYPACNSALFGEIVRKGCVISEFPPGTKPAKQNFPRRNRVIAGLSRAVMVVQASIESGSLITARFAAEYGRDVFAVPGDINRKNSEGTNWLLKNGAKTVTEVTDILEEYPELNIPSRSNADTVSSRVLEILAEGPADFSNLLAMTGLSRDDLFVELTDLQLLGKVKESGGIWQKS